jgi:hypothetical protein
MAAIRTDTEIDQIITRGQHTMADLGLEIVNERKQGIDPDDVDHRAKMYRLILLLAYFRNILNSDGELKEYYTDSANEIILNKVLNGIVRLSRIFDGPAIPKLTTNNLPVILMPSDDEGGSSSTSTGITRFSNTDIDIGTENLDEIQLNATEDFAMWVFSVVGSNSGEGSATVTMTASVRGGTLSDKNESRTPDVGGITSPITFDVDISGSLLRLRATASTNNWSVRGIRII